MKKLFLGALMMLVMVAFMPSSAWSITPDTKEACFLDTGSGGVLNTVNLRVDPTEEKMLNIMHDTNSSENSLNVYTYLPAMAASEYPGVYSSRSSCPGCHSAVDNKHDVTDNGPGQKRVDILLC